MRVYVKFRDDRCLQWLNAILQKLWPFYDPEICEAVKVREIDINLRMRCLYASCHLALYEEYWVQGRAIPNRGRCQSASFASFVHVPPQNFVQPLLDEYKPPALIKRIYFRTLTFGDVPFKIDNVWLDKSRTKEVCLEVRSLPRNALQSSSEACKPSMRCLPSRQSTIAPRN